MNQQLGQLMEKINNSHKFINNNSVFIDVETKCQLIVEMTAVTLASWQKCWDPVATADLHKESVISNGISNKEIWTGLELFSLSSKLNRRLNSISPLSLCD